MAAHDAHMMKLARLMGVEFNGEIFKTSNYGLINNLLKGTFFQEKRRQGIVFPQSCRYRERF